LIRTVGDDHEPRTFSTWAPVAIAAIGELPDTVIDRSVVIPMHRRRADETVDRFRLDRVDELRVLARQCVRWSDDNAARIGAIDPACPTWMSDRAADNWRVLLAIAEAAGGEAPSRAAVAARKLTPAGGAAPSVGTALLEDIKQIFEEKKAPRVTSADLVAALVTREERPWPEWRQGQALTVRGLARLLAPFGIGPKQWWENARPTRGYELKSFEDAFSRYLPDLIGRAGGAGESAASAANGIEREGEILPMRREQIPSYSARSPGLPFESAVASAPPRQKRMKPGITDDPE